VGLERGPLTLVSTTEELLGKKNSGFGIENRKYGCRDRSHHHTTPLYKQELALTSPTSGCRAVGIVLSRTKDTELLLLLFIFVRNPLRRCGLGRKDIFNINNKETK
jgi:hypothetical protein